MIAPRVNRRQANAEPHMLVSSEAAKIGRSSSSSYSIDRGVAPMLKPLYPLANVSEGQFENSSSLVGSPEKPRPPCRSRLEFPRGVGPVVRRVGMALALPRIPC